MRPEKKQIKKITEKIKKKSVDDVKISYGIYPTKYKQNYGFLTVRSSLVQNPNYYKEN